MTSCRVRSFFFACRAIALALSVAYAAPACAAGAHVGEVTLLVGEARVLRSDGSSELLQRGARVRVGDRVQTAANGHVHMRFVDNAAISVRPESVLEVQAYHYDPQNPASNEVRFLVAKGIARSISGTATELDKSRFRLNTPIAAIGVRGTDFIVHSNVDSARATVADGTIVVGALGPSCPAFAVGPCAGSDARELSANMGRLMAEVKSGDRETRILPSIESFAGSGSGDREQGKRQAAMEAARSRGLAAAEPTPAELQRGNDSAAAALLTLATVNLPLNRSSAFDAQLIWGRWGIAAPGEDRLSVPFAFARLGRHVTVADDEFGLFRSNSTVPGAIFGDGSMNATVEFRLTRASASFSTVTGSESATVTGSNLTVDFARRTFATGLDLLSASGVKGELRAASEIRPDGIFSVRDGDQRVSGAIAANAQEAGYLFERSAGGGLFRGITLWGK